MKIRTRDQLIQFTDDEAIWRKKELTFLFSAILNQYKTDAQKSAGYRSFVPLAYAHWEGFVKSVGEAYTDYVSTSRPAFERLKPCFQALYLSKKHAKALDSSSSQRLTPILEDVLSLGESRVRIDFKGVVNTRSNLSYEVLAEICVCLGFSVSAFRDEVDFIDKILLAKRNNIAHGSGISVDQDVAQVIKEGVIRLIDVFSNEVQNAATLGGHLRPNLT